MEQKPAGSEGLERRDPDSGASPRALPVHRAPQPASEPGPAPRGPLSVPGNGGVARGEGPAGLRARGPGLAGPRGLPPARVLAVPR